MNPESGGSPPRDNKTKGVKEVMTGALAQEVARALMVVELFSLKTINVENVMMKYRRRVRRVKEGANCKINIIHPKWAMEE